MDLYGVLTLGLLIAWSLRINFTLSDVVTIIGVRYLLFEGFCYLSLSVQGIRDTVYLLPIKTQASLFTGESIL